jgi:hypothetical protein
MEVIGQIHDPAALILVDVRTNRKISAASKNRIQVILLIGIS